MFGLGAGELILIAVVALLFVGPDKLPAAAKAIGKGIRDLRRQTSDLTRTIEEDTQIGDAVRDLRSALRGDDVAPPRRPTAPRPPPSDVPGAGASVHADAAGDPAAAAHTPPLGPTADGETGDSVGAATPDGSHAAEGPAAVEADGPVSRGRATRPAASESRPDVSSMAGLTTGTLRDRTPAAAGTADAPEAGDNTGDSGSGSAHG